MSSGRSWVREQIRRRVPLTRWIQQYSQGDALADAIAGFTLGLTLIPQSIAYALLAGLPPQFGLYSSFMGNLVYVFLGTVKEVSIGPTALMALLCSQYTHEQPVETVILLTLITGMVQLLMAVLRIGFLVELISTPVTSGFTSAYSIMIAVSQIKGLLGLRFKARGFPDTLYQLGKHIQEAKLWDAVLGVGCIVCLLALKKLSPKGRGQTRGQRLCWVISIARNALTVLACALLAFILEKSAPAPFALSGNVESGLPPFAFPALSARIDANTTLSAVDMASSLGAGMVVVPVVAVLANIAIAKAFSCGAPVDASQEMLTLAVSNILGSFVSSMPTCGAFTRSAVSSASGIRTPLAGLYSAGLILLALTFLTPYFYYIPKATLSAVLIAAVVSLVDVNIVRPLWRTSKRSLAVTGVTFVACLTLGVEIGLLLGIAMDLAYLVYLWARPDVNIQLCKADRGKEYLLVRPDVGLYFPAVDNIRSTVLLAGTEAGTKPVVIDCSGFKGLDYTAAKSLEMLSREFRARDQTLVFMGMPKEGLKLIIGLGLSGFEHCTSPAQLSHLLFGEQLDDGTADHIRSSALGEEHPRETAEAEVESDGQELSVLQIKVNNSPRMGDEQN